MQIGGKDVRCNQMQEQTVQLSPNVPDNSLFMANKKVSSLAKSTKQAWGVTTLHAIIYLPSSKNFLNI
jgi:hypothetical protein